MLGVSFMARKKKYPDGWFIVPGDIIIVDDEEEQPQPPKKLVKQTKTAKITKSKDKPVDNDPPIIFHTIKKKKTKFPKEQYNEYIQEQIRLVSKQPTTDEIRRLYAKAARRYSRYPDYENAILQHEISPQYYYGAPQLGQYEDLEQCRAKCIELLKLSLAK